MQRESPARTPPHDIATERLFIALTLPSAVRDALAPLVEPIPGVSWTRSEQLHVTLRFLGDVATAASEAMIARLSAIKVAPFVLPLETVGAFPPKRSPRVIWVGTGSGHPRLFQLRQRLDDALLASGIDVDVRTFHPHITIGRCADNAAPAVGHWLHSHRDFAAPPFRVESFDLYASDLRPSGAVHTLKQSFPLG
jgi:RNA 2',3'-cyclic 3'-phosphodiesterase